MEHSFNIELAKEYGILEAILLKNIWFWIEKNRANEKNFYDGTYWTYNSTRAFNELFPYASESSIKRALKSLQEKGIIKTGNYNKSSYDRTLWYAFTDLGESIMSNRQMETNKSSNGNKQNGLTIPDINTYINTDNILDSKESNCQTEVRRCLDAWNELEEYGIKAVSKVSNTSQRYQRLVARIKEYGIEDVLKAIEKIKGSSFLQGKSNSRRAWVVTFDWFVLPNNFPKVLDGNYDDHPDNQKSDVEQGNQKWKPASKLAADEWQ